MGNYDSIAQIRDVTYGVLSATGDQDKFLVDIAAFSKFTAVSKPADDAGAGTPTLDFPVLYTGNPIQFIALGYNSRLSIPADPANYVTFSAKRYVDGVFVQTIAEYKTNTDAIVAFTPAFMSPVPNVSFGLFTNDMLVFSISKTGAGKIVGAGNWQIVLQPV